MIKSYRNLGILCIICSCYIIAVVPSQHPHRHRHHYTNTTEDTELRRSGRYICPEQPEDVQRLKSHWEQWELHCRCPNTTAPVCGSDGVTYHNRCHLECTARNKYQRFSNERLRMVTYSPCPDDEHLFRSNRTRLFRMAS